MRQSGLSLTFAGADGEVTGSAHFLRTALGGLLVDCGFFQGKRLAEAKNHDPFAFPVNGVAAVLLTHAHLDHCGRLPKLVKEGYQGPIYCTEATARLVELVLKDTVNVLSEHARQDGTLPLYGIEDVTQTLGLVRPVKLDSPFAPFSGAEATFKEAGHILGSSWIQVETEGKVLVFSGDVGNAPSPLLPPPSRPNRADVVVCESTYGGQTHDTHESRLEAVHGAIDDVIKNRGVLLIPSFAMERTQELLFLIDALAAHHAIRDLPVFLDSPLAISVTDVYREFTAEMRPEVAEQMQRGDDPFNFPFLKETRSPEASKAIRRVPGPKIVIAGAGMMEGGRIHHHLINELDKPTTTLLIVGFQAPGTLGRELADGSKRVHVMGQELDVRAKVQTIGAFSAHADEPQILGWLSDIRRRPRQVFVVHGEIEKSKLLADAVKKRFDWLTALPELGQTAAIS